MELRQLGYFVAVARELSVTRAAEEVHTSQQNLSRQLAALEETLGVRLFERTTRGMVLTPAGAALLPEARRMLAQAEHFKRVTARLKGEPERLRVGVPYPEFARTKEFLAAFKHVRTLGASVELHVEVVLEGPLLHRLHEGALDVGFTTTDYTDHALGSQLSFVALFDDPIEVLMAKDHPLAQYQTLPKRMLSRTEFASVAYELMPKALDFERALSQRAGFAYHVTLWASSCEATLVPIALGTHIAFGNRKVTADLAAAHSTFTSRRAEGVSAAYTWCAVYSPHTSPTTLAFVDGYQRAVLEAA